jgi:hypothetical protein
MNDDMTWCVSKECPFRDTCLRNESKRKSVKDGRWISNFYDKDKECGYHIDPEKALKSAEKWKAMTEREKKQHIHLLLLEHLQK